MLNFSNLSNRTRTYSLIACFCLLGILGYATYDTIGNIQYKQSHKQYDTVQVVRHYHWKVKGIETLPGSDKNTFIGRAIVDSVPEVTTYKKGEEPELNNDDNFKIANNASSDYFKNQK